MHTQTSSHGAHNISQPSLESDSDSDNSAFAGKSTSFCKKAQNKKNESMNDWFRRMSETFGTVDSDDEVSVAKESLKVAVSHKAASKASLQVPEHPMAASKAPKAVCKAPKATSKAPKAASKAPEVPSETPKAALKAPSVFQCHHDVYEVGTSYEQEDNAKYFADGQQLEKTTCSKCNKAFIDQNPSSGKQIRPSRKFPCYVCIGCCRVEGETFHCLCSNCFDSQQLLMASSEPASKRQHRQKNLNIR